MRYLTFLLGALAAFVPASAAKTDFSTTPFQHPGVLLNRAQLDVIKQRVREGVEPQKSAFAALLKSPFADLNYAPSPRATIECGPYSKPDIGCKDERRDAVAAWSQALAWHVTG